MGPILFWYDLIWTNYVCKTLSPNSHLLRFQEDMNFRGMLFSLLLPKVSSKEGLWSRTELAQPSLTCPMASQGQWPKGICPFLSQSLRAPVITQSCTPHAGHRHSLQ